MRKVARGAAAAAAVALLAAIPLGMSLNSPYRGFEGEVFLTLERGTGARGVANSLARAGVIRSPLQFLAVRARHPRVRLHAGEYRFSEPASVRQVFERLTRGDVYYFDFTVPEGSNVFDIARLLESQGIMTGEEFLEAASQPGPIADLAPEAKGLEGYLFPSTYRISHGTSAAELCQMMTREFRRRWSAAGGETRTGVHAAVTLASLVEKETGIAGERPIVASVFANRLKRPMRLECDPTVIYAALLENRHDGVIHRSDLDRRHPYNTYQNDGLPPGPISNPGAASLEAAVHPAETDYLYFVAKPRGQGHVFSSTLAAHERAVAVYRHAARSAGKPPAARPPAAKAARKAG
jgi:UPF0755 protein